MQRSFDDLGTPLSQVTFVVIDLETTGGSPKLCAITEVGAVKLRGGECLGTLQTLVNPGMEIPREITYLTGITQAMVVPAPPVEEVLPSLLEFTRDAVIVGHNVRFDIGFLQAALARAGYPRLTNKSVDTCGLARRLIRDEVPNCKLGTLATHFRTATRPTHRALDDALATGEVLHCLLERAGSMGVLALDDLLALPTVRGHPQLAKLPLVANLPRQPGVYLFRDRTGRVLYVGKAVDIRRRVRSYFTGDGRRKVGQLLREVHVIDHIVCPGELEAAVLEVRLIHELTPRFNRQSKLWRRYAYLKLTLNERFPRLSVVRVPKDDGCLYIGPLSSAGTAQTVADAIESVVPIRRCTKKVGRALKPAPKGVPSGVPAPVSAGGTTERTMGMAPCAAAQLGVATCPCAGDVTEEEYAALVDTVVRGLTTEPNLLLRPLERRMRSLAEAGRYEDAAAVRDRAAALSRAINRQRRLDALRAAGRMTVEVVGGPSAVIDRGRLVTGELSFDLPLIEGPLPRHLVDELSTIAGWLEQRAARVRLVDCEGTLAWPLPRLPPFEPVTR